MASLCRIYVRNISSKGIMLSKHLFFCADIFWIFVLVISELDLELLERMLIN